MPALSKRIKYSRSSITSHHIKGQSGLEETVFKTNYHNVFAIFGIIPYLGMKDGCVYLICPGTSRVLLKGIIPH